MNTHERLTPATAALEGAIHAALDACDEYRRLIDNELVRIEGAPEPNETLAKRLRQFRSRIDSITTQLEDGVLDDLNFLTDRLFAVKLAEEGKFV